MTGSIIWRILIAVVVCVLLFALLPLVATVIGFPMSAAVVQIFRICIAGCAVLYIITGHGLPS
jgi:hypothetical protein